MFLPLDGAKLHPLMLLNVSCFNLVFEARHLVRLLCAMCDKFVLQMAPSSLKSFSTGSRYTSGFILVKKFPTRQGLCEKVNVFVFSWHSSLSSLLLLHYY